MNKPRGFKQELAAISRLWKDKDFDAAMAEVESLLKVWPGNAHLHVLWAKLVQLQDNPTHELDEAKQALERAVEFDKGCAASAIELGYFFDNVQDDPHAASKVFADGIAAARKLLIEGLIGQAKAFLQMDRRDEVLRYLTELLAVIHFGAESKRPKAEENLSELLLLKAYGTQPKGPYSERIQELLDEVVANHAAVARSSGTTVETI